jgi:hypothetical protein
MAHVVKPRRRAVWITVARVCWVGTSSGEQLLPVIPHASAPLAPGAQSCCRHVARNIVGP